MASGYSRLAILVYVLRIRVFYKIDSALVGISTRIADKSAGISLLKAVLLCGEMLLWNGMVVILGRSLGEMGASG